MDSRVDPRPVCHSKATLISPRRVEMYDCLKEEKKDANQGCCSLLMFNDRSDYI